MKKIILGLGALTTAIIPAVAAGRCGGHVASKPVANVDGSITASLIESNDDLTVFNPLTNKFDLQQKGVHVVFTVTPHQGNGKLVDEAMVIKTIAKLRDSENNKVLNWVTGVDLKVEGKTYNVINSVEMDKLPTTNPSILIVVEKFMDVIKTEQKLAPVKNLFKIHTTTQGTDASLTVEENKNANGDSNLNIIITPATGDGKKVDEATIIKAIDRYRWANGKRFYSEHTITNPLLLNISSITIQIKGQNNKITFFDKVAIDGMLDNFNVIAPDGTTNKQQAIPIPLVESKIYEIAKTKDETKSYFE